MKGKLPPTPSHSSKEVHICMRKVALQIKQKTILWYAVIFGICDLFACGLGSEMPYCNRRPLSHLFW